MRMRVVKEAFSATKYAKVPPESRRFEEGQQLVFLRHEGTDTIFALRSDGNRNNPYITTDEMFLANTEELKVPSPR